MRNALEYREKRTALVWLEGGDWEWGLMVSKVVWWNLDLCISAMGNHQEEHLMLVLLAVISGGDSSLAIRVKYMRKVGNAFINLVIISI